MLRTQTLQAEIEKPYKLMVLTLQVQSHQE